MSESTPAAVGTIYPDGSSQVTINGVAQPVTPPATPLVEARAAVTEFVAQRARYGTLVTEVTDPEVRVLLQVHPDGNVSYLSVTQLTPPTDAVAPGPETATGTAPAEQSDPEPQRLRRRDVAAAAAAAAGSSTPEAGDPEVTLPPYSPAAFAPPSSPAPNATPAAPAWSGAPDSSGLVSHSPFGVPPLEAPSLGRPFEAPAPRTEDVVPPTPSLPDDLEVTRRAVRPRLEPSADPSEAPGSAPISDDATADAADDAVTSDVSTPTPATGVSTDLDASQVSPEPSSPPVAEHHLGSQPEPQAFPATPSPYPGAEPAPQAYPGSQPFPAAQPYPGPQPVPGQQPQTVPGRQAQPFPGVQPSPGPGHAPQPYPGAQPYPGGPSAPQPQTQDPAAPTSRREARASFLQNTETEAPAQQGWRGAMQRIGIKVAPSQAEREERADEAAVAQHWPGTRTVAVVNGKGGAGKTPTTALLAAVFARQGGGGVLAWDNNETRGTLGWRTEQGSHESTVHDLLPRTDALLAPSARAAEVSYYVHHQTRDKYDVLRSAPHLLSAHQRLTGENFDAVHDVASKYFRLLLVDSGNDEAAEHWLRMIDHAHQLVVPLRAEDEHAEAAALLLEELGQRDERSAQLAARTVIVVSEARRDASAKAQQIAEGFRRMVRSAVVIPYDPAMVGGVLRYDTLRPATQRAWLRAAAEVARGL